MAMTNAEKVRAFREREKNKKKAEARKSEGYALSDIFVAPFFEFMERNGNRDDFDQMFDMIGLEAPEFNDDSGPKSLHGVLEQSLDPDWRLFSDNLRSLDRAEVMIGALLDAAVTLAGLVAQFKQRELDARIAEAAGMDLSDPDQKREAVARIVALTKMRGQLGREIRWPVPQWKAAKR